MQQSTADVAKQGETTFTWRDHPTVDIGDHLQLDFRARVQADVRRSGFVTADGDLDGVDIARRRVGVTGTIDRIATFEVERELDGNNRWRDVYLNYEQFPVQVQGGRFKLPLSLDENTSATGLDFVYRSRAATQLAPGRDVGVMAHGRHGLVRYDFGIFRGDGDNSRADTATHVTGTTTRAGRVVIDPFRGIATTRFRTFSRRSFFGSTTTRSSGVCSGIRICASCICRCWKRAPSRPPVTAGSSARSPGARRS